MFSSTKRGFTLIELLVVIAIIGLLSSIVLASLNSARKKGRDARRVADVKQLQLALELWYDKCGSYPATIQAGTTADCTGTGGLVSNSFIATIPNDPQTNAAYTYYLASGVYHLGANLEVQGNSALNSDADYNGAPNFYGADTASCTNTAGTYCYDVQP